MVADAAGGSATAAIRFDHREPGTPEAVWTSAPELASAHRLQLTDFDQLVVVAAHPDDESLGAGGLLAAATRLGLAVTVVIATLGERSHPQSPSHTVDDLRALRRAEVFQALAAVAPDAVVRLVNLADGRLTEQQELLVTALRPLVAGAGSLVVAPWRGDGHPDHEAAGNAAAAVTGEVQATLLEYPIWAWHWAFPTDLPATLLRWDLTPADSAAKAVAVTAHRSQVAPLSAAPGDEAILPLDVAAHFERPFEIFVDAQTSALPAAPDQLPTLAQSTPPPSPLAASDQRGSTVDSLPQQFFDDFYGEETDPWGFGTRWYERRKRDLTMAALPRERFASAFEPGCSIGVLTADLALRCDRLLATDISEQPLRIARQRLSGAPQVRLEQLAVPQQWPAGRFDLVVLSEMAYYCSAADLEVLLDRAVTALTGDGVLVACHWRHPVAEYPLSGDQVHHALGRRHDLALLADHVEEDFLLQVYTRPPAVSVATAAGLAR